ncbi:MAG: hypothetical protein HYZ81_07920 [Nitrospinae bacterium]|nr:hypothetical protein [Nitrospinota bacterium]
MSNDNQINDTNDRAFVMADEYDFSQGRRGPVIPPNPNQTRVWVHIDADLLDWGLVQLDARGGGTFDDLVNEALRMYRDNADLILARFKPPIVQAP